MKIFKLLFSKIFVSFLALLVQLALILSVLIFYEHYFVWFQITNYVFSILILLGLLNKKESCEFKLPWIVIILLLPFFGIIVFCMFSNSYMPSRQYKNMIESVCACKKYSELTPDENSEMLEFLGEYGGAEQYLRRNSFSCGHLHNKVEYFPLGEAFYADLLSELEKAEKFIFMEYFIIDRGEMWNGILGILRRKVEQGVEVRVMYDDIGTAGLLRGSYYKTLRRYGINCRKFNPFRPILSGIHNNRDHRKITVIDGKVGYTGGINIADESINRVAKYGLWKDTAIKIQGSAVGNLTGLFLQMFDASVKQKPDYSQYLNIEYERFENGGYIHPFGDGPKPVYRELVGSNNYINLINAAKRYVYISTPYLIPDYPLQCALRNAALRGVDVRIITPHVPDKRIILNMTRSNYNVLIQAGVKIYEYSPGFIHAKGLVSDDTVAFVGTINLDYRSLVHHYECGAVMYGTECIKDIKADFDSTLAESTLIVEMKMGFITSLVNAVLNIFSPML